MDAAAVATAPIESTRVRFVGSAGCQTVVRRDRSMKATMSAKSVLMNKASRTGWSFDVETSVASPRAASATARTMKVRLARDEKVSAVAAAAHRSTAVA